MNNEKHFWLYVLKLEQGKYYVGVTAQTPEARFKQHVNGFAGAEWTKLYKPIEIIQQVDLGVMTYEKAQVYENKVARKYIKEYGLSNVRGGDIRYGGNYIKIFRSYYQDKNMQESANIIGLTVLMIIFGLYTLIDIIFDKKFFGLWH